MAQQNRILRWLSTIEWQWSLYQLLKGAGIVSSFAIPAWAAHATNVFTEYQPLSWVIAGFAGTLLVSIIYACYAWARGKLIRSKYDRSLYDRTGFVDPMASTFENKRIFLADFVLPSDQYIFGKTFINCEIIGPANLFLMGNYQVFEQGKPNIDAVVLNGDRAFFNGIRVEDCTFRKCSFRRITLMMLPHEYQQYQDREWLNWISRPEAYQPELPGLDNVTPGMIELQSQPGTGEEKPQ